MDLTLEDRIRQRAYFLWLDDAAGGNPTYFWLIAEREVLAEIAMQAAAKPNGESAEQREARRVNALVQLAPGANREQTAADLVIG